MPKRKPKNAVPEIPADNSAPKQISLQAVIKRLLSYYFKLFPIRTVLLFLFVITSALANVIGIAFIGTVIDEYIGPLLDFAKSGGTPDFTQLGFEIIKIGGIYVVGVMSTVMFTQLAVILGQSVQKRIRDDMFRHMQSLSIKYFDTNSFGDVMSLYTNDVDAMREMLSNSLPQIISSVVSMTAFLITMVVLNQFLTIFVVLMTCINLLFVKRIGGGSAKYFLQQQAKVAQVNGFTEEMIHGQKVIKVFNHEQRAIEQFDVVNTELCDVTTRANSYGNVLMPIINNIGHLQYGLLAVLGGILTFFGLGGVTIGTIAQFLQLSKGFTAPIGQVSQQVNAIAMAMAGSRRVFAMMDEQPEQDNGYVTLVNAIETPEGIVETDERTGIWAWKHPHRDGTLTYTRLRGEVRLFDVDFGYTADRLVLHDITLYAKPGQKIAFVGATGAGKTTITNLLNRFYDIADGKIRYDGININKIKKDDLRRSLGVVLQDTHLFSDTIRENIRYGRLDATDEDVYEAARLANADGFIQNLIGGYDTVIAGDGAELSQGQKQLIAIARAAVADPPVMILDEATSSIDTRTETFVQAGMDSLMKGRTVFVIAHRLSTIQNADVILVLEQGRIIERGNHAALIEEKGRYYQLYTGKTK